MKTATLTGAIRKLGQKEPTYFVEIGVEVDGTEVDRKWVECQSTELTTWSKLRVLIFVAVDTLPVMDVPKDSKLSPQSVWERLLNTLMEKVVIVTAPPEATEQGALLDRTLQWIAGRSIARTSADFGRGGRRFETTNGHVHFRAADLIKALEQSMKIQRRVLWSTLEPVGCTAGVARVADKTFKTWSVPGELLNAWIEDNREGHATPGTNGTVSEIGVEDLAL